MYQIYFIWGDTLHVSDGLSVHHQEFKTVHTATGICTVSFHYQEIRTVHTATGICLTYAYCCMYSLELLMMEERPSETCRVLLQIK